MVYSWFIALLGGSWVASSSVPTSFPVEVYDAVYNKTVVITLKCLPPSWNTTQLQTTNTEPLNWTEVLTTADRMFDMPGKKWLSICRHEISSN